MSEITRWGFGMAPLKAQTDAQNRLAINQLKNFVNGDGAVDGVKIADEISIVKGLFNRIIRQDQWDWFTVNMYFDYPSEKEIRKIVESLGNLRKAILSNNNFLGCKSLEQLQSTNFITYCDNYLNFEMNSETPIEYIYILSRREEKDILKIGMTTRNVQRRVNEINAATGVLYPYSARKVYKVKNCRSVEKDIHLLLKSYRIRPDREFFEIEFRKACEVIECYLKETHQGFYDSEAAQQWNVPSNSQ